MASHIETWNILQFWSTAVPGLTEYPTKMEEFKNNFVREMEQLNFSIDETGNNLGAYTDEKFKEAQDSLDAAVHKLVDVLL